MIGYLDSWLTSVQKIYASLSHGGLGFITTTMKWCLPYAVTTSSWAHTGFNCIALMKSTGLYLTCLGCSHTYQTPILGQFETVQIMRSTASQEYPLETALEKMKTGQAWNYVWLSTINQLGGILIPFSATLMSCSTCLKQEKHSCKLISNGRAPPHLDLDTAHDLISCVVALSVSSGFPTLEALAVEEGTAGCRKTVVDQLQS